MPIPGGTKTDHLDDNLPAAVVRLSAEGLREIDYIFPTTPLQSSPTTRSLLVILHYFGRSHMRLFWITSGIPQSLTLPQQIPALI